MIKYTSFDGKQQKKLEPMYSFQYTSTFSRSNRNQEDERGHLITCKSGK